MVLRILGMMVACGKFVGDAGTALRNYSGRDQEARRDEHVLVDLLPDTRDPTR